MAITVGVGPARLLYSKSPAWFAVPSPAFTQGTPGDYFITSSMVGDADAGDSLTITYVGASLSGTGWSFVEGALDVAHYHYDGVGPSTINGAQLRATDRALPALSTDSASHSLTVSSIQPPIEPPVDGEYWDAVPQQIFTLGKAERKPLAQYYKGPTPLRKTGDFYGTNLPAGYGVAYDPLPVMVDWNTWELVYDGSTPEAWKANPNDAWQLGAELPNTDRFGSWSFETKNTNYSVAYGIKNGNKHMKAASAGSYFYTFAGDCNQRLVPSNVANATAQIWRVEPDSNAWILEAPAEGHAGYPLPWCPDNSSFCYDPNQNGFWYVPGYQYVSMTPTQEVFEAGGGLGTLVKDEVLFYSLATKRWSRPNVPRPFVGAPEVPQNCTFDPIGNFVCFVRYNSISFLDAANPAALGWQIVYLPLNTYNQGNPGVDLSYTDCFTESFQQFCKDGWVYCVDRVRGKLLRVALPSAGVSPVGKIEIVAQLPIVPSVSTNVTGVPSCQPCMVYMPSRNKAVIWWEVMFGANVSPYSQTFEVDLGTGVVKEGPPFPNFSNGRVYHAMTATYNPTINKIFTHAFLSASQYVETQILGLPDAVKSVYHIYSVT